jgi:outer membrane protein insertion porin family
VLLTVAVPSASAQIANPVVIGDQPCPVDVPPGRPSLKRRLPTSDSTATDSATADQKSVAVRCLPEGPASSNNNQKLIGIAFEGLHAFAEADVLKAFRDERVGLSQTEMPDSEILTKAVAVVKNLLESRGYFQATVATREDAQSSTLVFFVAEGKRLPLAQVRFEGNKNFSAEELESKVREYLVPYQKVENEYDSESFEWTIRRVLNHVKSRGYLQATFGKPKREIDARGLVISITVDEGRRYRLGEINIDGAEAVSPAKARTLLGLGPGDVANGEAIGKWLFEDLKKVYGELGFVEETAEPEPEFRAAADCASEGRVDLKVRIEEGRRFRLHTIKFQGSGLTDEELLRLLPIRTGEVFNQRLF